MGRHFFAVLLKGEREIKKIFGGTSAQEVEKYVGSIESRPAEKEPPRRRDVFIRRLVIKNGPVVLAEFPLDEVEWWGEGEEG